MQGSLSSSPFLCLDSPFLAFLHQACLPYSQAPLPPTRVPCPITIFPFSYQVAEGSYDVEANKTLLKLYLLYPSLANQEKVETVRLETYARGREGGGTEDGSMMA